MIPCKNASKMQSSNQMHNNHYMWVFFENEAVFRFNKEEWRKSNDIVSK